MPNKETINKWVRVAMPALAGTVLLILLIMGKNLLMRHLALQQLNDDMMIPIMIELVNPVYWIICFVMGYFIGDMMCKAYYKKNPVTTEKV